MKSKGYGSTTTSVVPSIQRLGHLEERKEKFAFGVGEGVDDGVGDGSLLLIITSKME